MKLTTIVAQGKQSYGVVLRNEAELSQVGTLRNPIINESAASTSHTMEKE